MVVVAQLVRAPGCGPGGRRFETDLPPSLKKGLRKVFPFFILFRVQYGVQHTITYSLSRTLTGNTLKRLFSFLNIGIALYR